MIFYRHTAADGQNITDGEQKMAQDKIQCDCVVIGGGAAGMMAAISAAANHAEVVIIEHTKRIGSKILQTGNGKCNFTNLDMRSAMYQNENKTFVETVLKQFDAQAAIEFFEQIGVYAKSKNGYVYPNSETASSLQDALRMELDRLRVQIWTECHIKRIQSGQTDGGKGPSSGFVVYTDCGCLQTRTIILATGSKAAPKTGSDGSGYGLAKALGHRIKKPLPALVQLISSHPLCRSMAGVRSTGRITLLVDGTVCDSDFGEVQYTEYGISGIPVFQISHPAVLAVDLHKEVRVQIDMLPDYEINTLSKQCVHRLQKEPDKTVEQFFSGLLNKKLVTAAAKKAGADSQARAGKAGMPVLLKILAQMKAFEFEIVDFKSFEQGQVCQGGVCLEQIDAHTMQSLLCEGVYFAGEIVDVDGKCGGYNLQWAWSSGFTAGVSAAKMALSAKHKI